ncbi:deoxyribodipyrimidine photo-lyase [Kineosporia sp. NBRC 101731]|uniref:cryptochrome/photolyase family protein n=1 Tax=Kineosporia sp. NBRC 101731 TaxID=3032199 RepID=UPI0024A4A2C3|nr:deoxyribodipyrimidine photo-lyase [Kineosporia sp. NBRC 101731]GLY27304.1 deoxyribodipyrimidine photo-lyase [Kineosporia sp. NBRC 101731]
MSDQTAPSIVLFTRDLRVHDNPALHAAAGDGPVVPLFVLDPKILDGSYNRPNRGRFLAESLADLASCLEERGAGLVIRRGEVASEVAKVAKAVRARAVHMAGDASAFAQRREDALRETLAPLECDLHVHDDSLFVVPPGQVTAVGKNHMAVFTPYHRKWEKAPRRSPLAPPRELSMPELPMGKVPTSSSISPGPTAPSLARGGESAGRKLFSAWLDRHAEDYEDGHDDLAGDRTSRISPYLHFGCLSPLEVVTQAAHAEGFVRQVAWRDFHHQVLAAHPSSTRQDFRTRHDRWRTGADAQREFEKWKNGRTGWPLVDAAMRQLLDEGWMHNRARLVVGHFLTKTLYLDWRWGAQHFIDHLLDGDTANNTMNWQWVAGTGTDSRFNRVLDVTTQALRYDAQGDYVRRYVPELSEVGGPKVHTPWKLPPDVRKKLDYPEPMVDVREGNDRFLAARGKK